MTEYYLTNGINVIAVNENKQAIFPWKVYQSEMISKEALDKQLSDPKAQGIAVICGAVSGNLEVIDIDTKYQTYDLWSQISEKIPQELYSRLHIINTKNNGYHLYYRCEAIEKNQKLAQRYATADEAKSNPSVKTYCIIETRGEAGYVVAPPSNGYKCLQQGINVLSVEEREELIDIMRSFNEVIVEAVIEAHNRPSAKEYGLSPFEDYNSRGDIVRLLSDNGWSIVSENTERIFFLRPGSSSKTSGSWNKQMNLFSVFSVNTPFTVEKGYKLSAVFAILECNSDFKEAARRLVKLGYGEKKTAYDESVVGASAISRIEKFWDIDGKGRAVINRYKLQVFLTLEGGFKLYFYDPNNTSYRLIRVLDGFVEEASTEQIKRFIKDYIDRLPDEFDGMITPQDLLELIYKGASILFSEAFFEFFDRADIDFLRDTQDISYIPFKNGVVVVDKHSVCLKSYGELNKCIWKSQVIDHYIVIDENIELEKIEYFKFIEKVSGMEQERWVYALSLIGYMLHKYKDPSRPYAVILAEETDNEQQGGGTGKGIFIKALSYLLNTVRIDGKNFKVDKNFAFQRVDLDTKILAIEDTRRNVDFEGFYSIITEGVTVEKKNKDELFIPYKDSPKVMFTTNYTIPNNGNHAKRRQKVFEFAPAFSSKYTPEDYFGHKLFEDWDKDEWNRFYNLMFNSIQCYLEFGIMLVESSEKLLRKQVKVQFGEEFLDYIQIMVEEHTEWVKLETLYNDFLSMANFEKKDYSVKRFTKAIEDSCVLLKVEFLSKRDKGSGGKKVFKFVQSEGKKSENFMQSEGQNVEHITDF